MVDEPRLARLLAGIDSDAAFLRGFTSRDAAEVLADEQALRSIKYSFITAIEGCARVAHHIAAAQGWAAAETNAGAVLELARRGILDRTLAESIADAVGFRNVLVHQYAEVDDDRTVGFIRQLRDFDAFTRSIARWLTGPDGGSDEA